MGLEVLILVEKSIILCIQSYAENTSAMQDACIRKKSKEVATQISPPHKQKVLPAKITQPQGWN